MKKRLYSKNITFILVLIFVLVFVLSSFVSAFADDSFTGIVSSTQLISDYYICNLFDANVHFEVTVPGTITLQLNNVVYGPIFFGFSKQYVRLSSSDFITFSNADIDNVSYDSTHLERIDSSSPSLISFTITEQNIDSLSKFFIPNVSTGTLTFIPEGYTPPSALSYSYVLKPGNILVFSSDSNFSITDLDITKNYISSEVSHNQLYGISSSLPLNTSINDLISTTIPFVGVNKNILGTPSYYSATISSLSAIAGNNIIISNPSYTYQIRSHSQGTIDLVQNSNLTISFKNPNNANIKVVSLSSDSSRIGYNSYVINDSSSTFDQISTTSDGALTLSDSNGGTPQIRGNDYNTPSLRDDDTISGILNSFLDSVTNLLQPGIGAINNLVQSGSSFMQNISAMYSWLPTDVTSVISSGLILIVVVGFLKVFL